MSKRITAFLRWWSISIVVQIMGLVIYVNQGS